MSIEIRVPDIGDDDSVEVIEVLINPGDQVEAEQTLITLESDKASLEIPAPESGTIATVTVKVGDKISKGDLFATLESGSNTKQASSEKETPSSASDAPEATSEQPLLIPDIGESDGVEVIEILVSVGDSVKAEQALLTLESDKASMEVPCPCAGIISSLQVKVGDHVKQGVQIGSLQISVAESQPKPAASTADTPVSKPEPVKEAQPMAVTAAQSPSPTAASSSTETVSDDDMRKAHASPSVRRFARELGVNLLRVKGSGRKSRISKEDVKAYVKQAIQSNASSSAAPLTSGAGIPPIPTIDFSKFGEVERVEMGRINKLSASNLHRAWLNVPHVTHHDEADITEVEDFRKGLKAEAEKRNARITGLVFHMKALAANLLAFPKFNSSLAPEGDAIIYKKYVNIGIAVDTPNGLMVPVFKDVDKKGIWELSEELMDVSKRARDKKLRGDEMQGACMTISSLGGIGGTAFTPIVNAPEVAILGITRASMKPVWNGKEFVPRLMCPLDISYDHRVIDGADAARFVANYCALIGDVRRLIL